MICLVIRCDSIDLRDKFTNIHVNKCRIYLYANFEIHDLAILSTSCVYIRQFL